MQIEQILLSLRLIKVCLTFLLTCFNTKLSLQISTAIRVTLSLDLGFICVDKVEKGSIWAVLVLELRILLAGSKDRHWSVHLGCRLAELTHDAIKGLHAS